MTPRRAGCGRFRCNWRGWRVSDPWHLPPYDGFQEPHCFPDWMCPAASRVILQFGQSCARSALRLDVGGRSVTRLRTLELRAALGERHFEFPPFT